MVDEPAGRDCGHPVGPHRDAAQPAGLRMLLKTVCALMPRSWPDLSHFPRQPGGMGERGLLLSTAFFGVSWFKKKKKSPMWTSQPPPPPGAT